MSSGETTERDRIARVVHEVNRRLVAATDRREIEAEVCELLADAELYVFAWIGGLEPGGNEVVARASAGIEAAYFDDVTITVDESATGGGPTGRALRTGELQAMQDIRNDPEYEPWREAALERGFQASAAVPLVRDDREYGVLNVYADRPFAFDDTERRLLSELGETVANAVDGVVARADLRESKERYERLTERISDAYYAVDNDWRITYWNDRMTERTGTPESAVLGERLWDVFPELEGWEISDRYREAMRTKEPATFETFLAEPYEYWVEIDIYPDGEGLSIFSREITERKRRERERRALIRNTTNPIYIKDLDGRYQLLNEAAADLFGLSPEAAVGATDAELFDAESAAAIREVDREIMETGESDSREAVRYVDGERHVFLDNKFPYRDATGEMVGVMGVSSEITDRKERERELRRTTELLGAVVRASPDAIVMVDEAGEVTLWNRAAEEIFGWTESEVLGEEAPFVPPEKRAEFESFLDQLDRGNPKRGVETIRQTKAGERLDVSLSSARVEVEGEFVGYMATIQDISQRVAYQERLERQNEELELLNRILRHDIRNDMQVVMALSDVIRARTDGETAEQAGRAYEGAEHAAELTTTARELMDTILGEGSDREPVALGPVLETEIDSLLTSYDEVVLRRTTPIPDRSVYADGMLNSVFRNLLKNAVQHNDGPAEIEVAVEPADEALTVVIADDGPGIPEDRREDVFGKGEAGLDSTGTGIGLYLVHTLVDRYGGDVWIEDSRLGGTAVHVRLETAD